MVNLGPSLQSVLRIVAAFIFMTSGTMKLFAFPKGVPPDGGTVQLISQAGIGGILEVFGGALLLLGLFTRPVAFILSGEMAVAFSVPLSARDLADNEWRHTRSPLLFCLALLFGRGRRIMEFGRKTGEVTR